MATHQPAVSGSIQAEKVHGEVAKALYKSTNGKKRKQFTEVNFYNHILYQLPEW